VLRAGKTLRLSPASSLVRPVIRLRPAGQN
jgi:hypothetical protein